MKVADAQKTKTKDIESFSLQFNLGNYETSWTQNNHNALNFFLYTLQVYQLGFCENIWRGRTK